MNEPLVSVLMSVYNGERYLREAIESILAQTFTDFEFLIINDGSTDGSLDIILSYTDTRIRLIDNAENIGLTKSLNKGISLARGKYIARMDADDISLVERLEKQVRFLEVEKEYVIIGTGAYLIDDSGDEIGKLDRPFTYDEILGHIFFFNPVIHPSVMFHREIIIKIGCYDTSIPKAQDYELWFRIIGKNMKIRNLPSLLIKHREHKNSIESASFDEQERWARASLKQAIMNILGLDVTEQQIIFIRKHGSLTGQMGFKKNILVIFLYYMIKSFKARFKSKVSEEIFRDHVLLLMKNMNMFYLAFSLSRKIINYA